MVQPAACSLLATLAASAITRSAPGKVVHSGPRKAKPPIWSSWNRLMATARIPKEDPAAGTRVADHRHSQPRRRVIVPAFAIERTQKFVFILKHLIESGQMPRIPVFCDSPMAIKAVEIFLKHHEEYSDETRDMIRQYGSPLSWPGFIFASTPEESKKINASSMPAVIISSSGMVTGGRILHHLAQRLPDPRNLVLFIGFQAPGTRGFTIKSKPRSQDFWRLRSHSSPGRRARTVQRPRRPTGTAAMAANIPAIVRPRHIWFMANSLPPANCAI